jgi:plasmid maintenance system killer protein
MKCENIRPGPSVFREAGYAETRPSADRVAGNTSQCKGALPPSKEKHFAAIIDPIGVGPLLRAIGGYAGYFPTKCALQLAPLLFVRPGELRFAEWIEFDQEDAMWTIPAEKMKGDQAHAVPLCRQATEILTALREATGASRYMFLSARTLSRNMLENAVNASLRRPGYEQGTMTGHGFRAMARTILDEVLQVKPEMIEHQLAHTVRGPLGRAYNRTSHLEERREMMQTWADYLDGLKRGATVVPIRRRACPELVWRIARRKLDMLDAAVSLRSLRFPPGNALEALKGDREGQHAIRINDQYRLCFVWTPDGPANVEIVDYH